MTFLHVRKNYNKKCKRNISNRDENRFLGCNSNERGQKYKIKNTLNSMEKKRNFLDRCLKNKKTQIFLQSTKIYFGHLDNPLCGVSPLLLFMHKLSLVCNLRSRKSLSFLSFIVPKKTETHHPSVSHPLCSTYHNMNRFPVFVHLTLHSVSKICLSALDTGLLGFEL